MFRNASLASITAASTAAATDTVAADTIATTTDTVEIKSRRPRGRLLGLVAALVMSLLAPVLINASPANAATVNYHWRTPYEYNMARYVQGMINAERRAHGLPALWMNPQLMSSARSHDFTMSRWNEMSHQLPGEMYFGARMDRAGYHWTSAGENVAWNSSFAYSAAAQVQNMMYNEVAPDNGHRLNILNPRFRAVGVDIFLDTVHKKLWMTTDFGTRM